MNCRPYQILSIALLTCFVAGCAPSQSAEQSDSEPGPEPSQGTESEASDEPVQAETEGGPAQSTQGVESETESGVDVYEAEPCEPLADDRSAWVAEDASLDPAYQEFQSSVRSKGSRRETSDAQREVFTVPKKHRGTCASWTGMPIPEFDDREFEGDCMVEFQADGKVSVIYQTTFCGGDACTIRHFVWDGSEPKSVFVETASDFASISVAPTKGIVVFDAGVLPPRQRNAYRLDTESGDVCLLAERCYSPRVAPDGQSVVCRNAESDVLAVSLDGGEAKVIHEADIPESKTTYMRPQWGDFPTAVRFPKEGTVEYKVQTEDKPAGGSEVETRVETFAWPTN